MKKETGVLSSKRGQFYLVAAIIIATITIGIFTIFNYSKKESEIIKIYDLEKEIKTETAYILDHGTYNDMDESQFNDILSDFSDSYVDYLDDDTDIYFLFGTQGQIIVKGYQKTSKEVSASSGSSQSTITTTSGEFQGSINPGASSITLNIGEESHEFTIKKGENLFFVIVQESSGGVYLAKN